MNTYLDEYSATRAIYRVTLEVSRLNGRCLAKRWVEKWYTREIWRGKKKLSSSWEWVETRKIESDVAPHGT